MLRHTGYSFAARAKMSFPMPVCSRCPKRAFSIIHTSGYDHSIATTAMAARSDRRLVRRRQRERKWDDARGRPSSGNVEGVHRLTLVAATSPFGLDEAVD